MRNKTKIFDSITELVGHTPLLRLNKLAKAEQIHSELLAKLEYFNPMSSVKDRIGLAMIDDAEKSGYLKPNQLFIEATSGNTGIALAYICAARNYRLIICMPEGVPSERKKILQFFGAEIELTPAEQGMKGAIEKAKQLSFSFPDAIYLQQFSNSANPAMHAHTTAEEIWHDCGGELDFIIAGVGTGGTLTGLAQSLKPRLPKLKIIAVEPEDSAIISGQSPGAHLIQGIGAGFVPPILETSYIDETIQVGNNSALAIARKTALIEGVGVGISSGAALSAAIEIGKHHKNKRIVVIIPSAAERYLQTQLFEEN